MSAEKYFGKVLRSLRTARGMSIKALAEALEEVRTMREGRREAGQDAGKWLRDLELESDLEKALDEKWAAIKQLDEARTEIARLHRIQDPGPVEQLAKDYLGAMAEIARLRTERVSMRRKLRAAGRIESKRQRQVREALVYGLDRTRNRSLVRFIEGAPWEWTLNLIRSMSARLTRIEAQLERLLSEADDRAHDAHQAAFDEVVQERQEARAELQRLRVMVGDVDADAAAHVAEREAEEMRALAWEWCIGAASWRDRALDYREQVSDMLTYAARTRRTVDTLTGTIWIGVGDVIEGVEGGTTTRLEIVYVSEQTLIARHLWDRRRDGSEMDRDGRESDWSLEDRDWKHVTDEPAIGADQ